MNLIDYEFLDATEDSDLAYERSCDEAIDAQIAHNRFMEDNDLQQQADSIY